MAQVEFIHRMIQFSENTGLDIHLVYYPPYHSKYNPIERCWPSLEKHWNGELLTSMGKVINWAKTMIWKGVSPMINWIKGIYPKIVNPDHCLKYLVFYPLKLSLEYSRKKPHPLNLKSPKITANKSIS